MTRNTVNKAFALPSRPSKTVATQVCTSTITSICCLEDRTRATTTTTAKVVLWKRQKIQGSSWYFIVRLHTSPSGPTSLAQQVYISQSYPHLHGEQSPIAVPPKLARNCPALQFVHTAEPFTELYFPLGHSTQLCCTAIQRDSNHARRVRVRWGIPSRCCRSLQT